MSRDVGPVLVPVHRRNQEHVGGNLTTPHDVPHAGIGVELPGHFSS